MGTHTFLRAHKSQHYKETGNSKWTSGGEVKTHCFYNNTSHFQPHRINNLSVCEMRLLKFLAGNPSEQEAQD